MANPAELLYDIFDSWHDTTKKTHSARNDSDLQEHMYAAKLLLQVEASLEILEKAGKNVRTHQRYVPEWRKMLFNYRRSWTGDSAQTRGPNLDMLGAAIEVVGMAVEEPDPEKIEKLVTYLSDVKEKLSEDDSLPKYIRLSAEATVDNILGAIKDGGVVNSYEFSQQIEQLLGTLATIALRSKRTDMWKGVLNAFVYPYAVSQLPGLPVSETYELVKGFATSIGG